jgi:hypothetical protein
MSHIVAAQQTIISGRVIDSQTLEPIPFAHVFIVNTSFGTATNDDGNFRLVSDNYGEADLVLSFVGYETYRKHIVYSGEALNLGIIRLKVSNTQLDEVVVKASRDSQWEKDLKKFKGIFLGKDAFASECTIDNPWVIDLQNDEATHTFSAKSVAPITVTNKALGYKLTFTLKKMISNADSYSIEGDSYFTPLQATTLKEREKWEANREMVYRHSLTNLLRSMVNHNINTEGFTLYSEMPGQSGSFTRMSRFGDNFGKKIQFADTTKLVQQQGPDKFIVSFKGRLEAHYRNERARVKTYQDVSYAVTWLSLGSNSVVVNSQGIPTNPTAIIVSGAMSDDRVARMLPLDYTPKGTDNNKQQQKVVETLPYLYEQIYVHTDKPYYYAGEELWFKGYVNYHTPSFRDSLSRTVYIDLITPEKKILVSKTLRIDSGRFSGQLQIPVGIDAGTYNLRAYTNLQRNFGDSTLYVKPIPLVELKDMVEHVPADQLNQDGITVTTSKNTYKLREKIEVDIKLTNEEGQPMYGDLSMSVTDMKQVSPIHPSQNITDRYPIKEVPPINPTAKKTPFTVEYGITLAGQFLNAAGKPARALVNVVQFQPKDLVLTESDDNGRFVVNHLTIYDSARFSITGSDKKGRSYGKAVLVDLEKAPVIYKKLPDSLRLASTAVAQRDVTRFSKDAHVLKEVEIRGKKTPDEYTADFRVRRPYGKPNFVLTEKDFYGNVYPNVIMMIQGRFPGLAVRQVVNPGEDNRWWVYLIRNERSSMQNVKEVVITVNDVFLYGTPEQILMMLNPSNIQSIELKTSISVLYGMVSNQGILAIYLKDGSSISMDTKTIGTVKATGYNSSPVFSSPDYETESSTRPDYRSLIYWNPILPISSNGTAKVSFFSADLNTTYRIEIEGVNSEGKPVRVVKMIEVVN